MNEAAGAQKMTTMNNNKLRIWASGRAHVWFDKFNGRESLADAIRQAESDFYWDFGINIGDYSAASLAA